MATLKCKMCGGDLNVAENATVCECEYCGTKQTVPVVDDEKIIKLYERANRLRMASEFDKAATVYESIIAEKDTDAEAYWGLVLCKFGIEYVDDPATGDKIPTCHRSSFDSVMKDSDFEMVMENADSISKSVYREQAKQIEEIRKGIIEVSDKEQPYDIFICYKETAENGQRTIDSVLAQDVYDALTEKGYRVFFSRISLEDKLGTEYEPYIFAALNSAKIMLAFGTSYDYYNAVWVKNEWSRFIKLMARDKSKHLIPCYKDIDAYDIPEEFARLQAQDMGKVGAIQDLVRGIDKLTGRAEMAAQTQNAQSAPVVQQVVQQVVQGGGTNSDALIQRGFMALEDKEWEKADGFFEDALNHNAQSADAYLGKLMVEYQASSKDKLAGLHKRFDNSKNYQKVLKFADDTLKSELENALKSIDENIENDRKSEIYQNAIKSKNNKDYESAIASFGKIVGYKDAQKQLEECKELARKAKDKAAEIDKKADAIAEALKNHGKQSLADTLRSQIKTKESTINSLNSKATELQDIATNLPSLEAEDCRLKTELANLENKMNALNQELSGLGFFAGKRKKEIAADIENLRLLRKQKEDAINENAGKMKGCNSASINAKIAENSNEIQTAKNELEELNKQLEVELNKPSDRLSYDEAMKLLKDNAIRAVFMKKYREKKYRELYLESLGLKLKGNNIVFGKYKNEEIVWRVLAEENGKLLIIADKALDRIPYNKDYMDITWEKCTLRQWLNNDFVNKAFTDNEKNMIALTDVIATKNPKYDTKPGNNTKDKVFLLSIDEVMKYFADDKARQCLPADSVKGESSCLWWLRSPGYSSKSAAAVVLDGSVPYYGIDVFNVIIAVRPALWINLGS